MRFLQLSDTTHMKNYILTSLVAGLALAYSLEASARERNFDELQIAAQRILIQNGPNKVRGWIQSPLKVLDRRNGLSVLGYTDGGFVLMGNDDQMPLVLGYSDDIFDEAVQTPNLSSYLEMLDGYINFCLENGREFVPIRRAGGANASVAPIVKTRWDQTIPYYNKTPLYNNQHCVTGCVATAAAQILYTLRMPQTMHGLKTYSFTNAGNMRQQIVYNYDDVVFDFDNMKTAYVGNTSAASRDAVAELMYCCGVTSNMNYKPTESGAYPSVTSDGINWFMDGIRSNYMGLSGNEQVVYDELDAGRAILYSGSTGEAGHAFVVDGYNEQGLVHCNMGWSGGGDGYYTLADMNGYGVANQDLTTIFISEEENYKAAPCADVPLGNVTVKFEPVTEIVPDTQWYVLFNVGRNCHAYSQGKAKTLMNTSYYPVNAEPEVAAPHLVRFVTSTNEKKPGYFIQTGDGFYYGSLTQGSNKGTTTTKTANYSFGKIKPGYFWIRDDKNNYVMDSNNSGAALCGWGQTLPTDTVANASWKVFPVEFTVPIGIEKIANEQPESQVTYDLQGRPVQHPQSGQLYLRRGKKVLYK